MTKKCYSCTLDKPLTDFPPRPTGKHGVDGTCRGCKNTKRRAQHDPAKCKDELLKARFGISLEQYNQQLISQNNCCGICEKPQSEFKKKFAVDHIHNTSVIRGLLCDKCNRAVGLVNDDANTAINMAVYLQSAPPKILTIKPKERTKRFLRIA